MEVMLESTRSNALEYIHILYFRNSHFKPIKNYDLTYLLLISFSNT